MGLTSKAIRWLKTVAGAAKQPKEISTRVPLPDADFHRQFYADTDVTLDTCAGVRCVLREQLRLCNTRPNDNVATLFPDVDIGEVCFEIADEFHVSFPEEVICSLDGTVDSLIRATQKLVETGHRPVQ